MRGVRGPARRMETSPAPGSLWFLSPAGKELVRPQTHETPSSNTLLPACVPRTLRQYRTIRWQRRRCLFRHRCWQIFRFTSSKPSKSAIASDEKCFRLRTNSFVRYCPCIHSLSDRLTEDKPSRWARFSLKFSLLSLSCKSRPRRCKSVCSFHDFCIRGKTEQYKENAKKHVGNGRKTGDFWRKRHQKATLFCE